MNYESIVCFQLRSVLVVSFAAANKIEALRNGAEQKRCRRVTKSGREAKGR